jgi:hypothetical protein
MANALVEIDLNVRVRGDQTYAGLEDVQGNISVGDMVWVHESESHVIGSARVEEIDQIRELVFLSVDWASLWVLPTPDLGSNTGGEPYRSHQEIRVESKPSSEQARQAIKSEVSPRPNDCWSTTYERVPTEQADQVRKAIAA